MTARKVYLGHNWKHRLSVLAAAAVLAGGLAAASTSNAFAVDNEISSSINIIKGNPTVLPPSDTDVGRSLGLEVDGTVIKGITEVSGLKIDQDVIELKQNTADGKYVIKKLPGRPKSGEVTLTVSIRRPRGWHVEDPTGTGSGVVIDSWSVSGSAVTVRARSEY